MTDRDDLGTDTDRLVWAPELIGKPNRPPDFSNENGMDVWINPPFVRRTPCDAIREAREARLYGGGVGLPHAEPAMPATRSLPLHLDPVRAPWCREQLTRRGAVTYAGHALPRGERWLRSALLVGGAALAVRVVVGLLAR